MHHLILRSTSIAALLFILASCVYTPAAYAPRTRPIGYTYQRPRPNYQQRQHQSRAFQLAANGRTGDAHAAAARGEGTENDVRRGQKVYHDKQMVNGFLLGVAGAAVIGEMSHHGEEHKCLQCQGRGYLNGDLDHICPRCGGSGKSTD